MTNQNSASTNGHGHSSLASLAPSTSFSSRDLIAIGFRHKRAIVITFCAILLGAVLAAVLEPHDYDASTKFLIERARLDPVVSPGQSSNGAPTPTAVSEEEMNSEVELVKSDDVLRQVVVTTGLYKKKTLIDHLHLAKLLSRLGVKDTQDERIANAVVRLQKGLKIDAIRKSTLIEVTYSSTDPQQADRKSVV